MKKYIFSLIIAACAALCIGSTSSYAANPKQTTVSGAEIISMINNLHGKVATCTSLAEQIKGGDNSVINEALLQLKETNTISKNIKKVKRYLSSAQYSQYLTELSKLAMVKSGIISASKWIKD